MGRLIDKRLTNCHMDFIETPPPPHPFTSVAIVMLHILVSNIYMHHILFSSVFFAKQENFRLLPMGSIPKQQFNPFPNNTF